MALIRRRWRRRIQVMKTLRRLRVALLVSVLSIALGACAGDGDTARTDENDPTVTVETFQFAPDPVIARAGTTITFVNEDSIDHTVTAGTRDDPTPMVFDGPLPEKGSTFELTLDEPGTYDYFCEIHPGPGMTARIIVEPAS